MDFSNLKKHMVGDGTKIFLFHVGSRVEKVLLSTVKKSLVTTRNLSPEEYLYFFLRILPRQTERWDPRSYHQRPHQFVELSSSSYISTPILLLSQSDSSGCHRVTP